MKTKKILLPGMMAALAFAACTNEEIVTMPNVTPEVDLSNRPLVGQVDLNFGPQGATRLAQGPDAFNQVVWTNNDKIGARIIDEPNGMNYWDRSMNYSAQNDFASSNYEYTRGEGANWTTEALLVEGHYMFYAPYNKEQGRGPLVMNFPRIQKINNIVKGEVNEEAVANFFGNTSNQTVLVGHAFVSANGKTEVSPFMEHLYAYPQITLKNANEFYAVDKNTTVRNSKGEYVPDTIAKDLKLKKIIIADAGNQIKDKYQVVHGNLIDNMKDAVAKRLNSRTESYDQVWNDIPAGDWRSPLKLLRDGQSSDIWKVADGATTRSVEIEVENVYTVANGEAIQFHAVLPALEYDEGELTVNVVFEGKDGNLWRFETPVTFNAVESAHETMTLAPGKRYPREEYDFSTSYEKGYSTKPTAGLLATFHLRSGNAVKYVTEKPVVNIQNAEEFAEELKKLVDNTVTIVENEDFVLEKIKSGTYKGYPMMYFNSDVVEAVKQYLDEGKVVFESQMIVEGDFTGNAAISESDYQFTGGVRLLSGSKLNLTGVNVGSSIFDGAATVNGKINGTATFNADATVNATITGAAYFNNCTATVNGSATSAEINNATVTVQNGADLGAVKVWKNGTLNLNKAYDGAITVGGYTTNSQGKKVYNNGTLNINVNQNVNAQIVSGSVVVGKDVVVGFAGDWKNENTTTLTNNGTITTSLAVPVNGTYVHAANAVLEQAITNAGTIENNGDITIAKNNGTVKALGKSTHTTVADGTGTIANNDLAYVSANAGQTVYYTFTKAVNEEDIEEFDGVTYSINKVIFNQPVTLNRALSTSGKTMRGVRTLEFNANLALAANAMVGVDVDEVQVNSTVTFSGFDKSKSGLGFKNGTTISVAENKTLTIAYLSVATMNEANAIDFDLASGAKVIVKNADVAIGKNAVVPAYTSVDNGTVHCGHYDAATEKVQTLNMTVSGTTYTVYTPDGLNEVADLINGNGVTADNFEGKTIVLANDINLNNQLWTPLREFKGTFDGNNKTISNLKVEGGKAAGFFGSTVATVKDLTIDGASVSGSHYVGVIAGYAYGTYLNCAVKNATVNCTRDLNSWNETKQEYDNDGDKAGAVVGYLGEDATLTNCTAYKSTVSAGRDAGQIVGAAKYENVTKCVATDVTVSANGSSTGANVKNEVIGRLL